MIGPDSDGPMPEGGYYVRHSRTHHVVLLAPSFINENPGNEPGPTGDQIKQWLKIYPTFPEAWAAASAAT